MAAPPPESGLGPGRVPKMVVTVIMVHRQVQKNLARGMSVSEIAEVLDETEKRIREIASADPGEQEE